MSQTIAKIFRVFVGFESRGLTQFIQMITRPETHHKTSRSVLRACCALVVFNGMNCVSILSRSFYDFAPVTSTNTERNTLLELLTIIADVRYFYNNNKP